MIRTIIIEDEPYARKELKRLLEGCKQEILIEAEWDSVGKAVRELQSEKMPDLLFLDIQLADGLSFEIFEKLDVEVPVIFTTAYDQFTLKAFSLLSVDYLLKPIDPDLLQQALDKFEQSFQRKGSELSAEYREIARHILQQSAPEYKKRFLGKVGNKILRMDSHELAYAYSEDHTTYLVSDERKMIVDSSLDQLEDQLNPDDFYRISRKMIVHVRAVQKIERYGASQWMLVLRPDFNERVLVSRSRSAEFMEWMDR